ncbi:MAG: hypothetical protein XD84_1351 [Desulfotomaculum sp. 46_80]|nr:MAG: hypothetical protein XD84_1351 [Desulfotomaculum sp. 46_80]
MLITSDARSYYGLPSKHLKLAGARFSLSFLRLTNNNKRGVDYYDGDFSKSGLSTYWCQA